MTGRQKIEAHSPADIKGMRIAAPPTHFPILRAWGAIEVDIPFNDRYMALERGTVDGSSAPMGVSHGVRLYEVTKSTALNLGALPQATTFIVMNEKVWSGLPPDIQKVFMDNDESGMLEMDKALALEEKQGLDAVMKAGHTVTTATPDEYKLWTKPLLPLQDKWVAEREAMGLPARAIVEETKRLISVYSK